MAGSGERGWQKALTDISGPFAFSAAIFGVVMLANWWGARRLKAKIEASDAFA